MRNEIELLMANVMSRFSQGALATRAKTAQRVRMLGLETLDISIEEVRRLIREGHANGPTLHSLCAGRSQLEVSDVRNPVEVGLVWLLLDAGADNVRQHYTQDALRRKEEIESEMHDLAAADLELIENELRRLSIESRGREAADFAAAAATLKSMRDQVGTDVDVATVDPSSVLGVVLGGIKKRAVDEVRNTSRAN